VNAWGELINKQVLQLSSKLTRRSDPSRVDIVSLQQAPLIVVSSARRTMIIGCKSEEMAGATWCQGRLRAARNIGVYYKKQM